MLGIVETLMSRKKMDGCLFDHVQKNVCSLKTVQLITQKFFSRCHGNVQAIAVSAQNKKHPSYAFCTFIKYSIRPCSFLCTRRMKRTSHLMFLQSECVGCGKQQGEGGVRWKSAEDTDRLWVIVN